MSTALRGDIVGDVVGGVDLGGTHMQVGLVDAAGNVVGRVRGKTPPDAPAETVCDAIGERLRAACQEAGLEPATLKGVGLAAPGAVDHAAGIVVNAPNIGWSGTPAAALLTERTGVATVLDNDVNAAVLAEHRLGVGTTTADGDLLGVWIGTGVGGGLILGGDVYHGDSQTAGEIGHIIVDPDAEAGPLELEAIASRSAICRSIETAVHAGRGCALSPDIERGEPLTSARLAEAAQAQDPLVLEVLDHAARVLGHQLSLFVTTLSLRRIVLGGGLVESLGSMLCPMVEAQVRRWAWPEPLRSVEVLPTRLGAEAGWLGAAMLARERLASRSKGS
ncbi:MAG: ROK family protein [Planctomycetota bacterium]